MAALLGLALCCEGAWAQDLPEVDGAPNPLTPVDVDSPHDSLQNFLDNADKSYAEFEKSGYRSNAAMEYIRRAAQSLNMYDIPPAVRPDKAFELVLMLREIMDRIPMPPLSAVPGDDEVREKDLVRWKIPGTEIVMEKITEGQGVGSFLFSPLTVERIPIFYDKVKDLPQRGELRDFGYEDYIYSPGWMIPAGIIKSLPDWARYPIADQAVWQWFMMIFSACLAGLAVFAVFYLTRRKIRVDRESNVVRQLSLLLAPAVGALIAYWLEYFLDVQVNVTGDIFIYVATAVKAIMFIFLAWGIITLSNIFTWAILHAPNIKPSGIDADLIRLIIRLVSLVLVFVLFYHVADYFGLSVTAVFASAGIAGVAVAFAARETLANFFGGISIFVDRPFRTGDYIVLETGERGEVKQVGMRSTRIQTRDDIMITIPNSVITNVKVTNQSAPMPSFRVRIKVGVAYGSNLAQVEEVLVRLANACELVEHHPAPRVRLRRFGDSSLDYELLCWAKRPHDRGRLVHLLSTAIHDEFAALGIIIPFPQRDVHLFREDGAAEEGEES